METVYWNFGCHIWFVSDITVANSLNGDGILKFQGGHVIHKWHHSCQTLMAVYWTVRDIMWFVFVQSHIYKLVWSQVKWFILQKVNHKNYMERTGVFLYQITMLCSSILISIFFSRDGPQQSWVYTWCVEKDKWRLLFYYLLDRYFIYIYTHMQAFCTHDIELKHIQWSTYHS